MKKFILPTVAIALVFFLASCSKKASFVTYSANQVAGTYKGTLTTGTLKHDGTADVSAINDSVVSIHCYDSVGFDTTFVMELYQNGDSVMLCNTGQAFFDQYGHYMSAQHHMSGNMMGSMSGMNNNDWQQHMRNQHQPGDEHFGSFDMDSGMFNYLFEMKNSAQSKSFSGKKIK